MNRPCSSGIIFSSSSFPYSVVFYALLVHVAQQAYESVACWLFFPCSVIVTSFVLASIPSGISDLLVCYGIISYVSSLFSSLLAFY